MEEYYIKLWFGFIVTMWAVGGMIGALAAGKLPFIIGLKKTMLYNNILVITASLLMGLCKTAASFEMLIIGKLLCRDMVICSVICRI